MIQLQSECPACGSSVDPDQSFCAECGVDLSDNEVRVSGLDTVGNTAGPVPAQDFVPLRYQRPRSSYRQRMRRRWWQWRQRRFHHA